MTRTHRLLVWLVPLALLAHGSVALACKCMPQSPSDAAAQADAIFEGRVTAIEQGPSKHDPSMQEKIVTLSLVRVWKELEDQESVLVTTSLESASCGYDFVAKASYLVYAVRTEHGFTVSGCSRTRPMAEASEDLAVLGGGITPVKIDPAPAPPAEEPKPPAAQAGGCATGRRQSHAASWWLALPAVGLVAGRRSRKTRGSPK